MQERGALLVDSARVFVPFGGLAGDCGQYKGRVVGYSDKGTGNPISYTVPTSREAGIWTSPGLTGDYYGHILAAVGNGAAGVGQRLRPQRLGPEPDDVVGAHRLLLALDLGAGQRQRQ